MDLKGLDHGSLLFSESENLDDHVLPRDKTMSGEQVRGRKELALVTSLGPSIKPFPRDSLVSRLFHCEANKSLSVI